MMGDRKVQQDALFYEFSLERHVPETHLLRAIDRFVEILLKNSVAGPLGALRKDFQPSPCC
jgi:hypothetical protein